MVQSLFNQTSILYDLSPQLFFWFRSFLYDRIISGAFNGNTSNFHSISAGVHQGTKLDSKSFLLHIIYLFPQTSYLIHGYAENCTLNASVQNLNTSQKPNQILIWISRTHKHSQISVTGILRRSRPRKFNFFGYFIVY